MNKKILTIVPITLTLIIIFLCHLLFSTPQTSPVESPPQAPTQRAEQVFNTVYPPAQPNVPNSSSPYEDEYTYTEEDTYIVPDRYNTGPSNLNSIEKFTSGNIGDIKIFASGENDIKIDFRKNPVLPSDIYIECFDFSSKNFRVYNEDCVSSPVTIHFINCIFSCFRGNPIPSNLCYEFNNCSFSQCYGSNMIIDKCHISGGSGDGLVPYNNVSVKNCYFSDKSQQNTSVGSGTHTDGVQIYGSKNVIAENIKFFNCRFELPQLKNSTATVNSCIMLQAEYEDANNIIFEKCKVNGGGYSIYSRAVKGLSLNNVEYRDISYGAAARWGFYCPCLNDSVSDEGSSFINVTETSNLYIGSVWREKDAVFFSVSNDTNREKTLLVKTSTGSKLFSIPACYTYNDLSDETSFSDYPFDILLSYNTSANCILFYDVTPELETQIRHIDFY